MKKLMAVTLAACTMLSLSGCMAPGTPQENIDETSISFTQYETIADEQEVAVIDTTLGVMKLVLFPNEAPKTVSHFRRLVQDGFYDGQAIFLEGDVKAMITGSADDTMTSGKLMTDDGKKLESEITQNLWHFSGAVSAWGEQKNRFSKTILSDSRFFIVGDIPADTELIKQMEESEYPQAVIDSYKEHGGLPQYTGSFTVFGQIFEGMDVVKAITEMVDGSALRKLEDVVINKITLSTYGAEKPEAEGKTE